MQSLINHSILAFALLLAALAAIPPAHAQNYPNRIVRFIVPLAPGGDVDVIGRLSAQALSERLGQPVVVENRPGAGSQLGAEAVARSNPDGYTLLFGSANLTIVGALTKKPLVDPLKDFTPVGLVARQPMVYAVSTRFPAKTLQELIAHAKSKPGAVSYGSSGIGSILHLAVALLQAKTGTDLVHVPYKGGGPMMSDIAAGQIDLVATSPRFARNFGDAGKLKVLAQASTERFRLLPDVPTAAEAGVPGIVVSSWFGVLGPANLPQPIVARLAKDLEAGMQQPVISQRLADLGSELALMPPAEFGKFIAAEENKWREVVKAAKIPLQDF